VLPDVSGPGPVREIGERRATLFMKSDPGMSAEGKAEQLQFVRELLLRGVVRWNRQITRRFPTGRRMSLQISAGLVSSPATESKQPALISRWFGRSPA
jgi:hypothetical protein